MAKHTNLSNLFTAIADAIRAKKGLAAGTKIVADNFPDEIAGIEIGGGIDTTISTNAATKNDIRTGKKAYVNGSLITGEFAGIDTTISTNAATKNHILSDKKAYVNGSLVTGNIPSKGADTYTPGTDTQTIDSGYYLSGTQYIEGDSNLKGSNIKKGVSIFGVDGTYTASANISTCTVKFTCLAGMSSDYKILMVYGTNCSSDTFSLLTDSITAQTVTCSNIPVNTMLILYTTFPVSIALSSNDSSKISLLNTTDASLTGSLTTSLTVFGINASAADSTFNVTLTYRSDILD